MNLAPLKPPAVPTLKKTTDPPPNQPPPPPQPNKNTNHTPTHRGARANGHFGLRVHVARLVAARGAAQAGFGCPGSNAVGKGVAGDPAVAAVWLHVHPVGAQRGAGGAEAAVDAELVQVARRQQ